MINELKRLARDIVLNRIIASVFVPGRLRWRLLRLVGLTGISRCHISPACFIGGKELHIGIGTFFNYNCFLDTSARITIGSRVRVGMNVSIITGTHVLGPSTERAGKPTSKPIQIGDGVWIGANSTLLPGISIGSGSVIAAGSVVVQSVEANAMYGGVPAKFIRTINN